MTYDTHHPSADETGKSPENQRVLIVDDEPAIQFAYRKLIEREGVGVDVSENLDDAFEKIKQFAYLAVIADVRLAKADNEDGCGLLCRVLREHRHTLVIFVSEPNSTEVKQMLLDLGASHYFEKPVVPSLILSAVKALTDFFPKMSLDPCLADEVE